MDLEMCWFYCPDHPEETLTHSPWKSDLANELLHLMQFQRVEHVLEPVELKSEWHNGIWDFDFWVPAFITSVMEVMEVLVELKSPSYEEGQIYHFGMDLIHMLAIMETFGCLNYELGVPDRAPCTKVSLRRELPREAA